MKLTNYRLVAVVLIALLLAADAWAQDKPTPQGDDESVPKFEVGGQYSKLRFENSDPSPAVAAFVTYNFTKHLSVEAEAYFYPFKIGQDYLTGGRPFQLQAGVKAGKRFRRFALFAKARPGFITFGETFTPKLGQSFTAFDGRQFFLVDFVTERKTHFALDLGGVVEYHASRRVFARFDAGDTLIRYGKHKEIVFDFVPDPTFEAPARTHLYPQFSVGVGVRLGPLGGDKDGAAAAATKGGARPSRATRFEVGAQFTSLSFSPIRQLFGDVVIGPEPLTRTQLGFGGRLTYNLTGHFAVEAETNFLPRKLFLASGASGRVTQGLFGVKAGRRFGSFGLFAKARPGFVSFGSSLKQVGTRPFTFDGRQFFAGVFEEGRRTFFATDVGGVVELYASRHWLLRFDAGDTVIRYGRRSLPSFFVNPAILVAPPETRHNFQFSSGAAFRF